MKNATSLTQNGENSKVDMKRLVLWLQITA